MSQTTIAPTCTFPHKTIRWKGHSISLHRWGPNGMWGVDASNVFGKTFFGSLDQFSRQRKEGYRFWAITITDAKPGHWPKGEYRYFKSDAELKRAHPDGILFNGGGHLWSLAQAIRVIFNDALIGSSPIDAPTN